jgi:hypothetical protein
MTSIDGHYTIAGGFYVQNKSQTELEERSIRKKVENALSHRGGE